MKKIKKPLMIFLWGILLFLLGLGDNHFPLWAKTGKASPKAQLIQIEDQVFPNRLRVILQTSRPVVPRSFTMTNPHRLVVDLTSCVLVKDKSFKIKDPFIEGLRVVQFNPKTVRLVFTVSQHPTVHISSKGGKPYQLFVDFPKTKPQLSQALPQKVEEEILPKITIEEFKKEKALQDIRLKKEKALAQKPLITFDFYMTNLHNVLRLIGEVGGVNIVVGEEVKDKKLTLSLKEVPWDEAMNTILEGNNLRKLKRGEKTILVTTGENYKKILDDENKMNLDAIKLEQEELKAEEQRQKVGKVLWMTRQFQIKNVDVKLVEEVIMGYIEKEKKVMGATLQEVRPERPLVTNPISGSLGNVNIISVAHTNTLIARGPERELDYIEELVKSIDQPISQVMIEARIVEADANFTRDMGIQWGGSSSFANANGPFAGTVQGTGSATGAGNNYAVNLPLNALSSAFGGLGFSFAAANLNIDVRIQAMEQQGRGKTISSPKILTLDNKEAIIRQGQKVPVTTRDQYNAFTTTYIDAALVLKVTPHISSTKKMRIKLDLSKDEPDFAHTDSLGNPTINTKQAITEMIVNDGDTMVIGGIIFKNETIQDDKIPGLGDIPLLGWLFKTRYRTTKDTELLIFLTPKIQKSSLPERFGNDN